ncbi:MAG TPA: hypothetical protein VM222_05035 [Planctomycetota bacterium]|nr:hypothetical protein [Planctomycetota bacterium]
MSAFAALLLAALTQAAAAPQDATPRPPFAYAWAEATYVLPETTSEESGYFSLCEGLDGRVYVGTAKYQENAYLVEFEPRTGKQRVVLDTNAVCGLSAKGYAAQAKLHTRNYVAPSGKIYVGSKQGYPKKGDPSLYPGGYVMTYDPAAGTSRNLGMPFPGQGVADVVADEARGLAYVITCEDQHWMSLDLKTGKYRELGPLLTPYATTLLDARGRAYSITKDFKLARYDPDSNRVDVLDIHVDGQLWTRPDTSSIPTWQIAADGRTAYVILMNDARLIRLNLEAPADAARLGTMVAGAHPDSRCALTIAPDGRVWVLVRVDNKTGFGTGYLHHLARYDPSTGTIDDLGVIAVKNPDYYDFAAKKPWSHGFHRLPDGTLTILHAHLALVAARDGSLYATALYPFTLLRIAPPPKKVAAIVTAYYQNSHADVIASRLLETDTLDGKGRVSTLKLASLYTDQLPGKRPDVGAAKAREGGVRTSASIEDALTLGTGKLAVDGVLLIAEHGDYPRSPTGALQYPKRRLFEEIARVFEKSGRAVPVFCDKQLSDTWTDAKWIYDAAKKGGIPLLAGSSLPVLWRDPADDVARGEALEDIVAISYGPLDGYGFHALEMVQCLAERRKGGETGVRAVQCLEGEAVWREGLFDRALFEAAFGRQTGAKVFDDKARAAVKSPLLYRIEYADGLKASVLTLEYATREWAAAWKTKGGAVRSTLFRTQEARPFMHFTYLLEGVEALVQSGRAPWPVERTLLTSGTLDALLRSKLEAGRRLETPELGIAYESALDWRQPPPPPPGRPLDGK